MKQDRERSLLKAICVLLLCCLLRVTGRAQESSPDDQPSQSGTLFPHSHTARWWVSGQVNIIFQAHPDFHALYSGPNSFSAEGEHATSRLLTLYTGFELTKTTEVLFDLESAGGKGLSSALGLAGFTNLDVVRSPDLGDTPYIARLQLHKIFALSQDKIEAERDPASTILTEIPRRRLELRFGKLSMADFFDTNAVGSDSHLQFLNWTTDNNGAWDYAADTRGFTVGVMAEYQDRKWGVRFAEALMPKTANGPTLDRDIRQARAENTELELRPELWKERPTTVRLLSYVNHANMGRYREATNAFLSGADPRPDITAHRKQGRIKYGFGLNLEQELSKTVRVFARAGWNEGRNESFAYTEVDQTIAFGGDWRFAPIKRPLDRAGLAFITNGISRDHQLYLALGGLGFLLGDGRLTYGRENIVESYYNAHLWRGLYLSPNLQFISHPGYNKDRGPVVVPGLRLHLEL
jgi:high affinity Mn2+ porin